MYGFAGRDGLKFADLDGVHIFLQSAALLENQANGLLNDICFSHPDCRGKEVSNAELGAAKVKSIRYNLYTHTFMYMYV